MMMQRINEYLTVKLVCVTVKLAPAAVVSCKHHQSLNADQIKLLSPAVLFYPEI